MLAACLVALVLSGTPPAPDYALPESWAAYPGRPGPTDVAPSGVTPATPAEAPVDVFFIHPTTYFGPELNAAVGDAEVNRRTDQGSLANQASAFNGCCRVFAPRYRQAGLSTFIWRAPTVAQQAWNLAYGDVRRAFQYYLEHENHGRPFIIASHSQGSRYALWLLQDAVEGKPVEDRFVAAYVIGYGIPLDWFSRNLKTIGPCKSATDSRCVVSWSTFAQGGNTDRLHRELHRYGATFESNTGKPLLCTNPLTWTLGDGEAPPALNRGGWAVGAGPAKPPLAGVTGARCENGALFVNVDPAVAARFPKLPGGNYHMVDYQLVYMNLRENAVVRSRAFLQMHPPASARAPSPKR